jgi:hypothetical protein
VTTPVVTLAELDAILAGHMAAESPRTRRCLYKLGILAEPPEPAPQPAPPARPPKRPPRRVPEPGTEYLCRPCGTISTRRVRCCGRMMVSLPAAA